MKKSIIKAEDLSIAIINVVKQKIRLQRTTLISISLVAFLSGLLIGSKVSGLWVMFGLLTIPILAIFLHKKSLLFILLGVILGFGLGMWRGQTVHKDLSKYQNFYNRSVEVSGRVINDPVYDDQGRLDFRIDGVRVNNSKLPGQIRIKARINDLRRGDSVVASGKLLDGFGNYQASMYFADVAVKARSKSPIETARREFFAAVYSVLPEPQASLGLGFLVGLRSALPEEFDEQLRIAGLTHIVVASGYNLTVLVRLSRRLLMRFSKYQALMGSLALIFGFVLVTGASPSMVRASVVTVLSLLAWYYGRRFQPVLIILLGAALTAGFNPIFIWYDLGWWLSFLAFSGVLILAPLISMRFWADKSPPVVLQVAIETSAAQIMATPLIVFTFGDVSLVALFANIAVVPLIPLAMIGTFMAGVTYLALPALAAWLAIPGQIILSYIVSVTQFFASPTWAKINISIGAIGLGLLYLGALILVLLLVKRSKYSLGNIPSVVE